MYSFLPIILHLFLPIILHRSCHLLCTPNCQKSCSFNYRLQAFIIDSEKRQELIKQDPKSAEIIRPILRGRDIKKYTYEFANLWLINTHNGVKGKNVPPILIDDYPAIKSHLDSFHPLLQNRSDKGDTPYNLRNCAYMEDFFDQKIIYPEITKFLSFYLDDQGFLTNNKCFILTGQRLNFLTAFLNSSLFKYCFKDDFPELLGGSRELRKVFMEQISVIPVNEATEDQFKCLIDKMRNEPDPALRRQVELKIDDFIFDLYGLESDEKKEIGFIEIR